MKGRTWCIHFLDDATKDGDVTVKWKVIQGGRQRCLPGKWEGYRKGMKAREKAERLCHRLKTDPAMSQMVGVSCHGNIVCIQLKDAAPFDDLAGVDIGDESGQHFHVYDDDPHPPADGRRLETVRFRLTGAPASKDGEVRLGAGHMGPRAAAATHEGGQPLAIPTILQALVESFHKIYGGKYGKAIVEDDQVIIPEVPCEEGASGGTTDLGLNYELSMLDPGLSPFCPGLDKFASILDSIAAIGARLSALEALHLPVRIPESGHPEEEKKCTGYVKEERHPDGTVKRSLVCSGPCPDGKKCVVRSNTNHHGGVREWCGCEGEPEPATCHVVIYTPGRGEGGGPQEVICAGGCDKGKQCRKTEEEIEVREDGVKIYHIRCSCS